MLARAALGPGRNKALVTVSCESDPPHGYAEQAVAGRVHVERIFAAQVDGASGGSVHYKLRWARPNEGVQLAKFQRQVLGGCSTQLRMWSDVHAADSFGFQAYGSAAGAHRL